MGEGEHAEGTHERVTSNAASTWGNERMEDETAVELRKKLEEQGYETRLVVEAKHPDSAMVKTIDSKVNADATLEMIRNEQEDGGDSDE